MNKILLSFILLVALHTGNVWGATITRYVNPGSAGGDGTTSALSGANAAYASLSAWEAAEQQDLTDAGGDIMVVNCAGTTADTTAVTINGWTTGSANYIQINGDNTSGKWDTSKYRLTASSDNLWSYEGNVRINGLQVQFTSLTISNSAAIATLLSTEVYDFRVSNSVVRGPGSTATGTNNQGIYGYEGASGSVLKIWNTIAYDFETTSSFGYYLSRVAGITAYAYNATSVDNYQGFVRGSSGGTVTLKNALGHSNSNADFSGIMTVTYSASSDATADDNGGAGNRISQTFTFVDGANDDFHLASGDAGAKDYGTNLSADANLAFSDDIDGVARSGTWDIGADEFVAAGGTFTPIISLY